MRPSYEAQTTLVGDNNRTVYVVLEDARHEWEIKYLRRAKERADEKGHECKVVSGKSALERATADDLVLIVYNGGAAKFDLFFELSLSGIETYVVEENGIYAKSKYFPRDARGNTGVL